MARITIDDLPQSDDLDREAMQSILGGGLSRVPPRQIDEVGAGSGPIVDYPPGFGGPKPAGSRPAGPKRPAS